MKAVIVAGGYGTRLSEETSLRPKPMVEIGSRPVLWHIMKIYASYGIKDFIICCGYKGYVIKEYFSNYLLHMSDITFDMSNGSCSVHESHAEDWRVTLVDTGEHTMTGGRLKQLSSYLEGEDAFCFTYGDGVADIDIGRLVEFHHQHGRQATVSAVYPAPRFGALQITEGAVTSFREKPQGGRINGGFFVLSPAVLNLIDCDQTAWEAEPMEALAARGELMAYEHDGFWRPMDTMRECKELNELWKNGNAPWKVW